jgi:hypothetical protein
LACCSRLSRPALSVATTDPFDKCGLGELPAQKALDPRNV